MVDTVDLDTRDGLGLSLEDVARWDLYRLFKNEPMTIVINTKILFVFTKKDSMQGGRCVRNGGIDPWGEVGSWLVLTFIMISLTIITDTIYIAIIYALYHINMSPFHFFDSKDNYLRGFNYSHKRVNTSRKWQEK